MPQLHILVSRKNCRSKLDMRNVNCIRLIHNTILSQNSGSLIGILIPPDGAGNGRGVDAIMGGHFGNSSFIGLNLLLGIAHLGNAELWRRTQTTAAYSGGFQAFDGAFRYFLAFTLSSGGGNDIAVFAIGGIGLNFEIHGMEFDATFAQVLLVIERVFGGTKGTIQIPDKQGIAAF